jgi:hypothetical protein
VLRIELVHAVQPLIAVVHEATRLPLAFLEAVEPTEVVPELMCEGLPVTPIKPRDTCVVPIFVTYPIAIHIVADPSQTSELEAFACATRDDVRCTLER